MWLLEEFGTIGQAVAPLASGAASTTLFHDILDPGDLKKWVTINSKNSFYNGR